MIVMKNMEIARVGLAQTGYIVAETEIGTFITMDGGEAVPAEGLIRSVRWEGVSGATRVVLDGPSGGSTWNPPKGVARIMPYPTIEELKGLAFKDDGHHKHISNPGKKPLRRLILKGLKKAGKDEPVYTSRWDLENKPTLNGKKLRLLVSIRGSASEEWIPTFAVPEVPRRGVMPAMLLGATFDKSVLTLPYAVSGQIRLSLVENSVIEDFTTVNMQVTEIDGKAEYAPRDLELIGPAGQVLWGMPGPLLLSSPHVDVDVRVHLETALQQALQEGRPLEAALTLKGAEKSTVRFQFNAPSGAVLREHPDVIRVTLAGTPTPLDLGKPLAQVAPTSATADIFVRYDGLRLLDPLVDAMPPDGSPVAGKVVAVTPVVRRLPPTALDHQDVARVGLIGRAPEPCELELQLIHQHGTVPGDPMGPPGILAIQPSSEVGVAWAELPPRSVLVGPAAISVRARRGRFYWASAEQPLVRIAVRDPDPQPQPLFLNDGVLIRVGKEGAKLSGYNLPVAAFADAAPVLRSDLFLTVDVTGLTLRYAR